MSYLVQPIPPGTKPSTNYNNLNTNASSLNTQYGFDHVALDAGANNGMHEKITFPNGISAPAATGSQIILYPNTSNGLSVATSSGSVGLFNIPSTTVGSAPFQLQRMVTPFGLIFYYGMVSNPSFQSSFTVTYPNASEVTQYASINTVSPSGPAARVATAGTGSSSFITPNTAVFTFTVFIITRIP